MFSNEHKTQNNNLFAINETKNRRPDSIIEVSEDIIKIEEVLKTGEEDLKNGEIVFDETPEIKEYTRIVIFCLKMISMLPLFPNHPNFLYILVNWLHVLVVDFISGHIMVLAIIKLKMDWNEDFLNLTLSMISAIIYITNTILLFYFQVFYNDLLYLLREINSTLQFRSAEGLTQLNMQRSFERARIFSLFFFAACSSGCFHWAIEPIIYKELTGRRKLPLDVWYPIDALKSPYYELIYLSQFLGQCTVATVYSTFGMLYMTSCILICGQFDLLSCSLRNLHFSSLRRCGLPQTAMLGVSGFTLKGSRRCTLPEDERGQYFAGGLKIMDARLAKCWDTEESFEEYGNIVEEEQDLPAGYEKEVMSTIKECVLLHQSILDLAQGLESFCSPVSFCKMCQITFLACFVMYSYTISENFQFPLLQYGILICVDLFVMCFFGNEVMLRSLMVCGAASFGACSIQLSRARHQLLLIMERAKRPFVFTGGTFYVLTLENFIGVLKASFSYYTVLRNMKMNKKE